MTTHVTYAAWTFDTVRARIIEAAETLLTTPGAFAPGLIGMSLFGEYKDEYRRGEATRIRHVPTGRQLAEMEETWTWINTYLSEADRRIVYEYGFLATRKGLTIAGWCERNGWIRRTFERSVNRACQRIANELNRKHQVRLTAKFDGVSQNEAQEPSFEVASDNRAQVRHSSYHRADDAKPTHDRSPESKAEFAKHLDRVNRQRREEAERQRKAALRKAEEAAKIVARHAAKAEARKRKQARAA